MDDGVQMHIPSGSSKSKHMHLCAEIGGYSQDVWTQLLHILTDIQSAEAAMQIMPEALVSKEAQEWSQSLPTSTPLLAPPAARRRKRKKKPVCPPITLQAASCMSSPDI